ncbi:MAG TPA: class I SAM-dependent methyltransferase [Acidimicrobiales bacterium]|nr:class I SAM-dependent methyltransferase [Acidimicrobiales bacterium]
MRLEYPLRPAPRYGWGRPAHDGLRRWLEAREPDAAEVVKALLDPGPDVLAIPGGRGPSDTLTWDNDWWGGVDAMVQYTALRDRRPATYLEVGSGFSTRFARRTIDDHGLPTRIVSIDPEPRAEIDSLCDVLIRKPLEAVDLAILDEIRSGDVVLVDCSHTAFMNSDAVVAFLELLPALPAGVLVGIDDVFLPWDYPPSWVDRWYGEQYLLAAALLAGAAGWRVRFPGFYMTQVSEGRRRFDPLWGHIAPRMGPYATSFWMEKEISGPAGG